MIGGRLSREPVTCKGEACQSSWSKAPRALAAQKPTKLTGLKECGLPEETENRTNPTKVASIRLNQARGVAGVFFSPTVMFFLVFVCVCVLVGWRCATVCDDVWRCVTMCDDVWRGFCSWDCWMHLHARPLTKKSKKLEIGQRWTKQASSGSHHVPYRYCWPLDLIASLCSVFFCMRDGGHLFSKDMVQPALLLICYMLNHRRCAKGPKVGYTEVIPGQSWSDVLLRENCHCVRDWQTFLIFLRGFLQGLCKWQKVTKDPNRSQEKQQNSFPMLSTQVHLAADCFGARLMQIHGCHSRSWVLHNQTVFHIALHAYPVGFHP